MHNTALAPPAVSLATPRTSRRKGRDPMLAQYPTLFSDIKTSFSVAWSFAAWHVGARLPVEWRWNASAHFECEEEPEPA